MDLVQLTGSSQVWSREKEELERQLNEAFMKSEEMFTQSAESMSSSRLLVEEQLKRVSLSRIRVTYVLESLTRCGFLRIWSLLKAN